MRDGSDLCLWRESDLAESLPQSGAEDSPDIPGTIFPDVDLDVPKVYRYHSEGYDDFGWGCVYRNAQTMLRALKREVPALPDLTRAVGSGDEWLLTPGKACSWIEPHDIAEYFRRFVPECGDLRLVNVATRDGARLQNARACRVGTTHVYELLPRPSGLEQGSQDALRAAMRIRSIVVGHLARTRTLVLIDDSINSYLVAGFRSAGRAGAEYRVLDPHYGMRYGSRGPGVKFDPQAGPDQFGCDSSKDQWVPAEWLEEGRGALNGYTPGPMWLMLLVG